MASDFEYVMHRLTLTGAEEEIIVVDDIVSDEKNDQIALCLHGKLLTKKSFNCRVMKTVFHNIWRPNKGVVIGDLDTNLFAFQFFSMTDKDIVLNDGPWSFDGKLLLLRGVIGLEQASKMKFETTHFLRETTVFAEVLGNKVGKFVGCDKVATYGVDKSLCFQVDVHVIKPLTRGIQIMIVQKLVWITLRYVPEFFYCCRMLGHFFKFYGHYDLEIDENSSQYGKWLRASPMKAKIRSADTELREERKLYLVYQGSKSGPKAKAKLVFDIATMPASTQNAAADSASRMNIDPPLMPL
ncbi:hypothetical protein Cgig2_026604 [Carnegiea gigantea]|uniref:DUF4283 domain-containing protein n=1 Tax=Carnegiea gigantea TaxID=171969 RepID=A0A9Q1KK26_9CARY|nr:hypothetical protein Cgig2_026604 [Carnegiea gigantea]